MTDPTLQDIRRFMRSSCPIYEHINLEILETAPGAAHCRVAMTEATSNHVGTVHAGIQWIAAEAVGGVIALQNFDLRQTFVVIRAVEIEFIRPAEGSISAEGRLSDEEIDRVDRLLREVGKADFEVDVTIATDAECVTKARGRYQIRRR